MSDNNEPPERDVADFDFVQLCKFRVTPSDPEIATHRLKLLTVSSAFGYLIYATKQGFTVVRTSDLMAKDEELGKERNKVIVTDIPVLTQVDIPSPVIFLDSSLDGKTLSVVIREGNQTHILFYDIQHFADKTRGPGPFAKAQVNTSPSASVVDLAWNPAFFSLLAVCTSEGGVELLDIKEKVTAIGSLPAAVGATCFCWSPRGKQLLVGKSNGCFTQYDHTMAEKRLWPCPTLLSGPHRVVDVVWQSTYVFMAAFLPAVAAASDQPLVVMTLSNKEGNTTYINFEDVCYSNGEERQSQYYFHFIQKWELILIASSNATETTVVGKNLDDKVSWEHWNMEDYSRAELPLTDDKNDSFPTGLAVDYSPQKELTFRESKKVAACPVMYLLSTDGILVGYHMVYRHKDAVSVTTPALTPAAPSLAASGLQDNPQSTSSPFGAAPSATGTPSQSTSSPFGAGPAAIGTPSQSTSSLFGATSAALGTPSFSTSSPFSATATATGIASQVTSSPFGHGTGAPSQSVASPFSAASPAVISQAAGVAAAQTSASAVSGPPSYASSTSGVSSSFQFSVLGSTTGTSAVGQAGQKPPNLFQPPASSAPTIGQSGSSAPARSSAFSFSFGNQATAPTQSSAFAFVAPPAGSSTTIASKPSQQTQAVSGSSIFGTTPSLKPGSEQAHMNAAISSASTTSSGFGFSLNPQTTPDTSGTKPVQQPFGLTQASSTMGTTLPQPSAPSAFTTQSNLQGQGQVGQPGGNGIIRGSTPHLEDSTPRTPVAPSAHGHSQPPPPIRSTGHTVVQSPSGLESQRSIEATVDDAFIQNIAEEVADFEHELQEFRRLSRHGTTPVGTREEMQVLRQDTEKMRIFTSEVQEATKEQAREAQEQKNMSLKLFAMALDCKTKQERDSDPHYNSLLQNRMLDPASAERLKNLQQMSQEIEHNIVEVDHILNTQWEEHLAKKKEEERLSTPTGDKIYKTIRNNNTVLANQRRQLEKVEKQLHSLKLYNRVSNKDISGVIDLVNGHKSTLDKNSAKKPEKTLSSAVADGMTPEKISLLRDILCQRKVPTVKSTSPANLSMSRIISVSPGRSPVSQRQQQLGRERFKQQTPGRPLGRPQVPGQSNASPQGKAATLPQSNMVGPMAAGLGSMAAGVKQGQPMSAIAPSAPTSFSGQAFFKQKPQNAAVATRMTTDPKWASVPRTLTQIPPPATPPELDRDQLRLQQSNFYEDITPTETDETNDEDDDDDYDDEDNGYEDEEEDEEEDSETGYIGRNKDAQVSKPVPGLPQPSMLGQTRGQTTFDGSSFGTDKASASSPWTTSMGSLFKLPPAASATAGTQAFTPLRTSAASGQAVTTSSAMKPNNTNLRAPAAKDLFGVKVATTTPISVSADGSAFGEKPSFPVASVGSATTAVTTGSVFGAMAAPSKLAQFSDPGGQEVKSFGVTVADPATSDPSRDEVSTTRSGSIGFSFSMPKFGGDNTTGASTSTFMFGAASTSATSAGGFSTSTTESKSLFGQKPAGVVFGEKPSFPVVSVGSATSGSTGSVFGTMATPSKTVQFSDLTGQGVTAGDTGTSATQSFAPNSSTTVGSPSAAAAATTTGTSSASTFSFTQSSPSTVGSVFGGKSPPSGEKFSFSLAPSAAPVISATGFSVPSSSSAASPTEHVATSADSFASPSVSASSISATPEVKPNEALPLVPPDSTSTDQQRIGINGAGSIGVPSDSTSTAGAPGTEGVTVSGNIASADSTSSPSLFGSSVASAAPASASSTFSFSSLGNSTTTASVFGNAGTSTTTASVFGNAGTSTTTASVFGSAGTSTTTASVFGSAGSSATTASVFGNAGTSVTTASVFGNAGTSVTTASVFGNAGTSVTTASVFGNAGTSVTTASVFGNAGTSATTTSVFGNAGTSATTTSVFGNAGTSTTTASVFGNAGTSTSSVSTFGNAGTSPSAASVFGNAGNSTTSAAASTTPAFGTAGSSTGTASVFGNTGISTATTPVFGNTGSAATTPSVFGNTGASTASSVFGQGGTTGTPKPTLFGTPDTSASSLVFGSEASTTSSSLFGSSAMPSFGFGGSTPGGLFGGVSSATTSSSSTGNPFGGGGAAAGGLFGSSSGTTSGKPNGAGLFGSTTPSGSLVFGSNPGAQSAFGQGSAGPSGFGFGQVSSDVTTTTPAFGQAFGQSTSDASGASLFSSGGGFGGLGGKPSEEKTKQNVFGVPQQFGSAGSQSQGLFGSGGSTTFGGVGASSFPNTAGGFTSGGGGVASSGFGVSSTQQTGIGFGGAPTFGRSPTTAGFGTTPAFGSSPSFGSAPAFSSSPAQTTSFGSTSGFSSFANAPAPSFGQLAQSSSTSGFGSAANGSGASTGGFGSTQATLPGFGGTGGTGGFGSSQPAFGGGGSVFGQQPSPSSGFGGSPAQGFGNTASFGNSPAFSSYRG